MPDDIDGANASYPSRFDVWLFSAPNKAEVIAAVRELTNTSQQKARDLVFSSTPTLIVSGLDKASAEAARDLLTRAHAVAEVSPTGARRARTTPSRSGSESPQEIVEYRNHRTFDAEWGAWVERGWKVQSVTEVPQRSGCLRYTLLGFVALIFRPEAHVRAVYEREGDASPKATPANTTGAVADVPSDTRTGSLAEDLRRIAELHERGVLTDVEFELAKQRLLGSSP